MGTYYNLYVKIDTQSIMEELGNEAQEEAVRRIKDETQGINWSDYTGGYGETLEAEIRDVKCYPDDWAKELVTDIYKASGHYVEVQVDVWYAEREPDDTLFFDEDDYEELKPSALEQLATQAEEKEHAESD